MISVALITQWLTAYGYAVLFPIVVVEGPIVTVIAGFLASIDVMNLYVAYAIVVVGDLAGDCMYYAFGRWGGKVFIEKYGHYVGATPERLKDVEGHFDTHGGKTLAVGKLLHGIGAAFLMAAGIVKMPFRRFFWYNLIATIPKSLALILIGYYLGEFMSIISKYLTDVAEISFAVLFVAFLVYFIYFRNPNELPK
jgi:membrane protein DedA with SNARE-associated domain